MSELVANYEFTLPPDLVASRPLAERDASRMLVLDRRSGRVAHRSFRDFPEYLGPGDLAVLNNSKVIKARLRSDDGRIELLLVEPLGPGEWLCLAKPGRKMRPGFAFPIAGAMAGVVGKLHGMASIVAAGRSTARDRYGPACRRQPNTQVPVRVAARAFSSVQDASGVAFGPRAAPRPCPAGPTGAEYGGTAIRLQLGRARRHGGFVGAWQPGQGR